MNPNSNSQQLPTQSPPEFDYMDRALGDISAQGYEAPTQELSRFLAEEMEGQYPPDPMQLEAIVKGILTRDVLLVQGPPGTGKTTVVSAWVKYFLRQGKRVLISAQNDAAVDAVLTQASGAGEILRLGNQDQVQENCRQFLLHNKLDTAAGEFDDNRSRVRSALARDKEAIAQYRLLLESYAEKMEVYSALSNQCAQLLQYVGGGMNYIQRAWDKYISAHEQVQAVLEQQAHKQLFLEEAAKKNFFARLRIRPYVKNVRRQLQKIDIQLQKDKAALTESMKTYNQVVQVIRGETEKLRGEDILRRRMEIRLEVEELLQQHFVPGMTPLQLCSQVRSCYRTPAFSQNPVENLRIVLLEMQEMERLESVIRETEKALEDWYAAVESNGSGVFQNVLLQSCQLVGATCACISADPAFANVKFDVVILEESHRIPVPDAVIPMSLAPKTLLLGDCVQDADSREAELGPVRQLVEKVVAEDKKLVTLSSQFRTPGDIFSVLSHWFYGDNYASGYDMEKFAPMVPDTGKPLVVISTSRSKDRRDTQPETKQGYYNRHEADLVAELVARVIENRPEKERREFCEHIEDNIGIISYYDAQVQIIREKLAERLRGIEPRQIDSMVASPDSFRGRERPLIICSLTRSAKGVGPNKERVGSMKDLQWLRIAFTRCQTQLVVLGDMDYLCSCMNTELLEDEAGSGMDWPCRTEKADPEQNIVQQAYIDQCARCPAACERRFARFMRLLMQHVRAGNGDLIHSIHILREQTTK